MKWILLVIIGFAFSYLFGAFIALDWHWFIVGGVDARMSFIAIGTVFSLGFCGILAGKDL